ncbi:MAG: dodecin domain-containing protein [Magnetococcales bacterium]|nr:dodecin domain-containing protein [Magnetococcales bacterium]
MPNSVYKVIEVIGSSPTSWEEAAELALQTAGETLRNLKVAEVTKQDLKIQDGKVVAFRTRMSLSFKVLG